MCVCVSCLKNGIPTTYSKTTSIESSPEHAEKKRAANANALRFDVAIALPAASQVFVPSGTDCTDRNELNCQSAQSDDSLSH